jgi:hypothetical protein
MAVTADEFALAAVLRQIEVYCSAALDADGFRHGQLLRRDVAELYWISSNE